MRRSLALLAALALAGCVTPEIEIESAVDDVITLKVDASMSYVAVEAFATQACNGDRAGYLARDPRPGEDAYVTFKFKCQRLPAALRGFGQPRS